VLARNLLAWLDAPEELRQRACEALVATARERFSWEGVANGAIAAARGRTEQLAQP
jgi:hypothetical protein